MFSLSQMMAVRRARSYACSEGLLLVRAQTAPPCTNLNLLSRLQIGDIRSRLVRLIPSAPSASPLDAIRVLLSHRLPAHCSEREAREEWRDIVEGRSALWAGIPNDRKEAIRGIVPVSVFLEMLLTLPRISCIL
jgi:hypothetical protein